MRRDALGIVSMGGIPAQHAFFRALMPQIDYTDDRQHAGSGKPFRKAAGREAWDRNRPSRDVRREMSQTAMRAQPEQRGGFRLLEFRSPDCALSRFLGSHCRLHGALRRKNGGWFPLAFACCVNSKCHGCCTCFDSSERDAFCQRYHIDIELFVAHHVIA